ncbi:MAG TPA: hypothetical protein VGO57_11570 [Verrucomicrobiae bacterium]
MKITPAIFALVAALLTTSCVFQAHTVSTADKADHHSVILYGRFDLKQDFAFGNKLAIYLQNLDTKSMVYIFFDPKHPLQVVQVKPGHYQLAGFVGVNSSHEKRVRQEFYGKRLPLSFIAAAGSQIYLGDFQGEVTSVEGQVYTGNTVNTLRTIDSIWKVKSFKNNFAGTTMDFREQYPKLRTIPAVSVFDGLN